MTPNKPGPVRPGTRPTIGLLMHSISDNLGAPLWAGAADAAREQDANLICFSGGMLRSPHGFDAQRNVLYDLVSAEAIDGLVVWAGILSHYIGLEELQDFVARYRDLPIVSIEIALDGIPAMLVDFHRDMSNVIAHLIEVHGYRRIAFIRGPEGSRTGDDRYRAYVDTLAKYGIAFDSDLVTPGTFFAPSGAEAVRLLLDERKVDFQAIGSANDNMAIDAIQALQARGIRVPGDVAVVGFDDLEEAGVLSPPLTTARIPLYEWGQRGIEILSARLRGEEVPQTEVLSAELVVRQSCGCPAPEVVRAAAGSVKREDETLEAAFAARRERILSEMQGAVDASIVRLDPEQAGQLLDAFVASLTEGMPDGFLPMLDEILQQVGEAGGDVAAWNELLSVLRRHALPYLGEEETRSRAEDLWQQARVVVGRTAQRAQAYQRLQADRQAETLREVGQALVTSSGVEELMGFMVQDLPQLGIPSCYLSLYEDPRAPTQWSWLLLAYDEGGHIQLEPGGRRFPSRQLVPAGMLPRGRGGQPDRPHCYVVEPLYFREDRMGFVLLEAGTRERLVYEALRGQISSALWGARLLQRAEKRALQLQTAAEISRAASSILDPGELLPHVVDLIRGRFDLYYVGLFLVDRDGTWTGSPGKWAVLRAGTGKAGQEMLDQGHKLEVGGRSMIGACMANGEARIALDIGKAAVRFENPLLPETHSELALPLISRGEAIGALTIQSSERAAFSEEDVTVLQTMADQIANAIENTRLFKQTQEALREMEAVQRRYVRRAWSQYLDRQDSS